MSNCVITVNFTVKPSHIKEFTNLLKEMAVNCLQEPGCLNYEGSIDGNEVFLYEKYKSEEAIDFHVNTKHYKEFMAKSGEMLVTHTITRYTSL